MKAQNGSRSVAVLILNLGARWGWFVNATPWPLYSQKKIACAGFREGWVGPMAGLDGYEEQKISCLHQPDSPASSEMLYVLATLQYASDKNTLQPMGKSHKFVMYKSEKFLLLPLTEYQSWP
jgi:hypothetical protein